MLMMPLLHNTSDAEPDRPIATSVKPYHQSPLGCSAQRLKSWTIDKALPIWAARGQFADGSWAEHLWLSGQVDDQAQRRWRVLARQIYVYAQAAQTGWYDGLKIAQSTHKAMMQLGYIHRAAINGQVMDTKRDLYDHAFYLLAHTSLYKLTGQDQYLQQAEAILTFLDQDMAHKNGGWAEYACAAPDALRRQNPHMHIFEASLYLYGATRDQNHLGYAHKIYDLFTAHFFNRKTATIREFFTKDWRALGAPLGTSAEPGHAAEWVWLLWQYQKASGVNTNDYSTALYNGLHKNTAYFLNDEEDETGMTRRETKRLWVQTELIKAHLAQAERGVIGCADMAAALMDGLFGLYLTPDGLWHDQINACGINVAKTIPASTFYHILCMAVEAERVAKAA